MRKINDKWNIRQGNFLRVKRAMNQFNLEGLVVLGAGGDQQEWIDGLTNHIHEQEGFKSKNPDDVFAGFYSLVSTGGRNDLVMVFKKDAMINMGRLAIVRLMFRGDISWLSDFIPNYAKHYGIV